MSNVISDDYFSDRNIEKIKEESRKQGAVEELKNTIKSLNKDYKIHEKQIKTFNCRNKEYCVGLRDKCDGLIVAYEQRLKELEGEQK